MSASRSLLSRGAALRRLRSATCLALVLCAPCVMPRHAFAGTGGGAAPAGEQDARNRQYQQAEALYLAGRLKEAAAAFDALTQAYPRDARGWLKYGNTLTRLGSLESAAAAFQTAASLDPAQGAAQLNLALVRIAQAQSALAAALGVLAPASSEHAQADALQRELSTLLGNKE